MGKFAELVKETNMKKLKNFREGDRVEITHPDLPYNPAMFYFGKLDTIGDFITVSNEGKAVRLPIKNINLEITRLTPTR